MEAERGAEEGEPQDGFKAMSSSSLDPAGAGGSSMAGTDAQPPSPTRSRGEEDRASPVAEEGAPAAPDDTCGGDGAALAPAAPPGAQDGGDDVKAVLTTALECVLADSLMVALKLWICGIFLASCELRLFSRLGVLSLCLPLLWLPAMLLCLPAVILVSGRTDREPDCRKLYRYISDVIHEWD